MKKTAITITFAILACLSLAGGISCNKKSEPSIDAASDTMKDGGSEAASESPADTSTDGATEATDGSGN